MKQNPTKKFKRLGLVVVDATSPLKLKVIEADGRGAVCSDHEKCVVAKTIKRKCNALSCDVGNHFVFIQTKPNEIKRYYFDAQSKEQVKYFDNKGAFAPCSVRLLPPPPTMQLGYRSGANARSGPSGKKRKTRKVLTTR